MLWQNKYAIICHTNKTHRNTERNAEREEGRKTQKKGASGRVKNANVKSTNCTSGRCWEGKDRIREREGEITKRRLNGNGQNAEQRDDAERNTDKQIVWANKESIFKTGVLKHTHTHTYVWQREREKKRDGKSHPFSPLDLLHFLLLKWQE